MAIQDTELIAYGSLNRPEDDVNTSGGAIDADNRPVFTQMAAQDTLEVLSDNSGDTTQQITVTGRDAAGAIQSDTKTLNGTTPVALTGTFERVLKAVLDSDGAGTVTLRRASAGPTVGTIPAGERGFFAMFIKAASESGATTRYEKTFWKNTNGTLTLNDAKVRLAADPSAVIKQGVAASKDDSGSVANRKTSPGVTFVDDSVDQDVPGTTLEAGSAIGVWWELSLGAGASPIKDTFTARLSGTSV